MHKPKFILLVMMFAMMVAAFGASAQDDMGGMGSSMMDAPTVQISPLKFVDQGYVTVTRAFSDGPGFIVIHADDGSGNFGAVLGHRAINPGWNNNFNVPFDASQATGQMFAMLHTDDNEIGVYEFGAVEGADAPVAVDGEVIAPAFNAEIINVTDQFVTDGTLTIDSITTQQNAHIAIHTDADGGPGPVIGSAFVEAGTTNNVVVTLDGEPTSSLWPMLHVDDNEEGVYEFGAVEGADAPVFVDGNVAVTQIWTVPHVRADDQIVVLGDGMEPTMAASVFASSVLSDGPGFLVIHADNDGSPGPVLGVQPVNDGLNLDVTVTLDEPATNVVWPMLHVDTGEVGTYEFGTVEGADAPAMADGSVVTFPINAAPSMQLEDTPIIEAMMGFGPHIVIDSLLIDAPGWVALHIDNGEGGPGPVIGTAPLLHDDFNHGLNKHVVVEFDPAMATETVFPMLHYDTGEAGVYEFGTVEGADTPVFVGGNIAVGPVNILPE
ncbi:MAG: hypothetical protein D6737_07565 [Chloroflexi bacterium]|nr:MAG: hypothetical protein CUN54_06920 [Phototrophicales bacterium]RMF80604.1 MAG: hypothetical protein D6737_07565 [Chloroflexota bacterium]